VTTQPVLMLDAARGEGASLPHGALNLALSAGDFALVEIPGPRHSAAFADLCTGLVPLVSGSVRFLGREWHGLPEHHADALRGRIGRLFHRPMRTDTGDVTNRILLRRLHHTRVPEDSLREEAALLAQRFGLPGLPVGPARLLSEPDLLRAACVRAFVGEPRLLILELPLVAQHGTLLQALLAACAEARGRGASVMWLASMGPALRDRSAMPTHRLRLDDSGLVVSQRPRTIA
jgi:phospholipid/cholesterol/gamma-HCH transport system ATP-binding protein